MTIRKMWLLTALACLSLTAQAQMSGSGTENDPYLVKTPDDLFDIRNDLSACYKLANDIDLTEWIAEENPTNGWAPIDHFTGTFDGDGHTISGLYVNRPSEDCAGLFGECVLSPFPTFKNIVLRNPVVTASSCAGALAGRCRGTFSSNKVIGGKVTSNSAGGLVGSGYTSSGVSMFIDNVVIHSQIDGVGAVSNAGGILGYNGVCKENVVLECIITSDISGLQYCGGIVARSESCAAYKNYASGNINGRTVGGIIGRTDSGSSLKNRFDGTINGTYLCRGIADSGDIQQNIVTGSLSGSSDVYGITSSTGTVTGNICCTDTLLTTSSSATIARIGVSGTNYAYNGMVVKKNGVVQTVNDGGVNGTSYSLRMLKRKNTYTALGYDFENDWDIVEGVTLPYLKIQSTPATIEKCLGGENAMVSGTATGNGTVYVFVDGEMFTGTVTGGKWSVELGTVEAGTTVKVSVETQGKKPSIIVKATAIDPSEDATEQCATPTISFTGGKLHFDCATEGVTFHYSVTNGTTAEQTGNDNELPNTYTVTVYATKDGYNKSEVATQEIVVSNKRGDMNGDGIITVTDAISVIDIILGNK